jgi:hypothetical protein
MRMMIPLLFLATGCGDKDNSGADDTQDTQDTGATCDPMNSGEDWDFQGQCPGMQTPCEILVEGCSLTINYSSGMTMGMPYAGTIEGSTIHFEDGDSVLGCVGTLEDEDNVTGTCDGGCEFTLRR